MDRIIKTIPATDGELYVISAGQRLPLAGFNGRVEITERTNLTPLLGRIQKGTKKIVASFIVCNDLEYHQQITDDCIRSGKVYEAVADVNGEKIYFAGLKFEDSDPLKNELIFEIVDLELIQKFIE